MTLSDTDFATVRQLLLRESGQVLEPYRREMCALKLAQLSRAKGIDTVADLVRKLRSDDALLRAAVEVLLNGETSFFRDPAAFRTLEREALPALMKGQENATSLRIWCAACSTGQEPYSVRMLLDQSPLAQELNVELLATDYSSPSIEKAKTGTYSQHDVNRGLPARTLAKYFKHTGRQWTVEPGLRERVRFERLNLVSGQLPSGYWDLILLRNVLIYFPLETKKLILDRVLDRLAPAGLLMLGGSETTMGINEKLAPAGFGGGFFQRAAER